MESSNRLMTYDEEKKACEFIDELPESALEHSERFTGLIDRIEKLESLLGDNGSVMDIMADDLALFLYSIQDDLEDDLKTKKACKKYGERFDEFIKINRIIADKFIDDAD